MVETGEGRTPPEYMLELFDFDSNIFFTQELLTNLQADTLR